MWKEESRECRGVVIITVGLRSVTGHSQCAKEACIAYSGAVNMNILRNIGAITLDTSTSKPVGVQDIASTFSRV